MGKIIEALDVVEIHTSRQACSFLVNGNSQYSKSSLRPDSEHSTYSLVAVRHYDNANV